MSIENLVKKDSKVYHSYFFEFHRRLLVLRLVQRYCPKGSLVLDLGASPFIISCALNRMGYKVIAVDVDPEPYKWMASECDVGVCKCDLERERVCLGDGEADCAVFSEVLEHLNPYYVNHTLWEINRVLKIGGFLVLTTPNIASLFRRIRLLIGKQPQYKLHVHEYTMSEVTELLQKHGFKIIEAKYSEINDLTYVDTNTLEEYMKIYNYLDLIRTCLRKPTSLNMLRALAYPIVKMIPTLRMLIVIIARKERNDAPISAIERW